MGVRIVVEIDDDFRFRVSTERPIKTWKNIPPRHLVLLIHGMNIGGAAWQTAVQSALAEAEIIAKPLSYGTLGALRFWCPVGTRESAVRSVHRKIAAAMREYPDARLSAIAHSFGTYAIAEILHDYENIPLYCLILCGSVLHQDFRWGRVNLANDVVNECSRRDYWPVVASKITLGYGPTGTFGFGAVGVRDRFHDLPHSGYLKRDFARKFWVPWILDGDYQDGESSTSSPCYIKLLNALLRPLILVLLGYAAYLFLQNL